MTSDQAKIAIEAYMNAKMVRGRCSLPPLGTVIKSGYKHTDEGMKFTEVTMGEALTIYLTKA